MTPPPPIESFLVQLPSSYPSRPDQTVYPVLPSLSAIYPLFISHPPIYLMDGFLSTSTSAFSHLIFNDTNAHSINSWQSVSPTCHHCSIISPYRRAIPRVFRWRIQNWAPRRWHRRDRPLGTVELLLCVCSCVFVICIVICIVGVKVGGCKWW